MLGYCPHFLIFNLPLYGGMSPLSLILYTLSFVPYPLTPIPNNFLNTDETTLKHPLDTNETILKHFCVTMIKPIYNERETDIHT